ncbi:alpha/beta fold hydrolase [Streptomyces sp. NBC_01092]|uniref:alpha/beta fold hydrolase n=1 Tax=Streptomyces sp. NBC_01092 TaxID=2903748 RepID=UPI00386E907F|nr:alpha/beta fold hydrolase [Streptomyces sp. NBC_01092]
MGTHPHDRGDRPARGPRGHPPRTHRRRDRSLTTIARTGIHGRPQTWYGWWPIMPELARHHTVYAVDLPGLGDSTGSPTGYANATLARYVHTLIADRLGVGDARVIGHDLGATVAFQYAGQFPVDRVLLAGDATPLHSQEPFTMHEYDVTVATTASPEVVWKLLVDASSWPLWSKVDSLDTARSVDLDPGGDDGVGAVRAFRTGRTVTGERLTEKVEQRLLAYKDAFNSSMHNYHARIELQPTASSGTVIHWYGTYETSRLLGWVMPRFLQKFMQGMAEGLAHYAEECKPAR